MSDDSLERIADALYARPPEDFVAARDDEADAARRRGERDLARAVGRLRRPTRPAWLANLLARHCGDQLDGLFALASGLREAQSRLDGHQLRALSTRRHRTITAMTREAGRLAQFAGSPATAGQLRELQAILEAAIARPEVAQEVRCGRLTRTLRHTGFGPQPDDHVHDETVRVSPTPPVPAQDHTPQTGHAARQLAAERAELRRAVAEAEELAADTRDRCAGVEADLDGARTRHARARARVGELSTQLEAARRDEGAAVDAERAAADALREARRAAAAASARAQRARARLDELT